MNRLAVLLMLAAVSPAAAQIVEGSVVNAVTGMGIAGVKVSLSVGPDLYYSTTSDAQGRFRFDHVQDGLYTTDYSAPDYQYSDMFRGPVGPRQIQVTKGTAVTLEAHMMPMGRLSGRVVDSHGQGVPKAAVEISGPGVGLGVQTDAQGKFEEHRLLFPGAYTISAIPPPGFKPPDPEPGSDAVLAWTRTYYPGMADQEAASKVVVPAGSDVSNIDIKLLAAKAHSLRGLLLHPDGKPAAKVEIQLNSLAPALHAESHADGTFEFPAVVDGHWQIYAEAPGPGGATLQAGQALEMSGRDREGIKLQLNLPFIMHAHVVMETPQGMQPPRPRAVLLLPAGRSPGMPRRAQAAIPHLDADGSTTLQSVYPDKYEVAALPPPGYYLDAVRVGDAELSSPTIDLTGPLPITAYFKANGGTVRGTAEHCDSGEVLLVAQDPAVRWLSREAPARCDGNRYEFTAVRPGNYYVIAIAPDPGSFFSNVQWNDGMINQTTSVTVRAGEVAAMDLKAIR